MISHPPEKRHLAHKRIEPVRAVLQVVLTVNRQKTVVADAAQLGENSRPVDDPLARGHPARSRRAVTVPGDTLNQDILHREDAQIFARHRQPKIERLAVNREVAGVQIRAQVGRIEVAQQVHQRRRVQPHAVVRVRVIADLDVVDAR